MVRVVGSQHTRRPKIWRDDQAGCVVVLWSSHSVASDWVREEALEGAQRRILVPVLTEDVNIPLGFRRIQAAHLENWQKGTDSPEFRSFVADIAKILGSGPPPRKSPSAPADNKSRDAAVHPPFTGSLLGRRCSQPLASKNPK
jgi:hypothetical protein